MVFLRHWFAQKSRLWRRSLIALCCLIGIGLSLLPTVATAQSGVQQGEDQVIREFSLPRPAAEPPVYRPPAAQPRRRSQSSGESTPRRRTQPEAAPAPRQRSEPRPAAVAPRPVAPRPAAQRSAPTPEPEPTPQETAATPVNTGPNSQYVLEFNRSPIVGNRLRLQGVYPQARIGFTRPRNWEVKSAKALIRFQHSPTLLADRSVLMVRVNDTSVGSVPLNRPQSQIGQVLFNIPANLIQDYNEISLMAEQQTSDTCTNPADPTLWSEILPDSKITFDYQPQAIPLDFGSYPYPFFDDLNLDPNRITYLRPNAYSEAWLTATARHQAAIGRQADFRPLETRLITSLNQADITDRLVVIGTPEEQPALRELNLPFRLQGGKVLEENGSALPDDVGVLMLTTTETADGNIPVLVATGNAPAGVTKAVQFLVQQGDREIGTGNSILVSAIDEVNSPDPRQWQGFLPTADSFQLADLQNVDRQPFREVTVQGTNAPPIRIPFKALPDDRFSRGSTMKLNYSYSPQVNPRTSALEVRLDGTTIASKRLGGWFANASRRESFNVNLPEALIQPDSELEVQFVLNPRESASCGIETDQSLYGTVHTDTTFNLNRDNVVQLPDLKLLKAGYPIAAPQDLSAAAIVLPDSPNDTDVNTLLAFSERMGRLTQADSVKLNVYRAGTLPAEVRNQSQLVGIGTRDRFPLPEALNTSGGGLNLSSAFTRQRQQSAIQTLGDSQGLIKQVVLPEGDRTVLALTAQSEAGLREVQTVLDRDPLFSQLRGDTVLIRRTEENPSPYDAAGYSLEFLQQATPRRIINTGFFSRLSIFLQDFWFLIPTGIILIALLLYVFSQLYLNRVARSSGDLK
ncbi:cellulose biosynthesis cyclic di-GMP-binding regulatory protein BcsB [Microcoleus sp. FACHB-1515]|uniref:cellulose biosynthesis cyclic di-GMP-binding regulatory protein BcsB n=1 Tax=Cyanophyceae TaxID=3028117 RepID=UPI001685985D|nr:cellulose biosynthesis cyclic di-GMP-binding regulatory protein BcsB [Microcoleus sp. FACHB-1515]MBD2088422.1 cellulose biosynthesis cyclic di-GMP-binding regulatory protein BcsB [Microcoleus sp. FACHB-1515]